MKYCFTVTTLLCSIFLFSACTKENDFLEKTTWTGLSMNTTSSTKIFEVWLDNELIQDSLTQRKILDKAIPAGEHKLRIRESAATTFFVDTVINTPWSAKKYQYSLIELDPASEPLFFSGFPEDIPAVENGFVTFSFLNIDATITKDKTIDILLYSMDDPNVLLYEFKNIHYNQISAYFKVPVEVNNNGGFLVIRDSQTEQLLLDGRDTWLLVNFSYYSLGQNNTLLYKFNNVLDAQNPYYECAPIFEATR